MFNYKSFSVVKEQKVTMNYIIYKTVGIDCCNYYSLLFKIDIEIGIFSTFS